MVVYLQNTLTRKKEEFIPIHEGKVGIYACGLTVYGDGHIGNYRTFLFTDALRRLLEFNGFEVKLVMNITDVGHLTGDGDEGEDKMIVAMQREGKTAWDIAKFYTERFLRDMARLNMRMPHILSKATEHIEDRIQLIQEIEKNGFAYRTSDGLYFDTSKLSDYGKLTGQALAEKEEGARIAINPEKRNATDFALWKFSPAGAKRDVEWDSPWGVGFPGWHIECSAMSERYLDVPFDIHTGGADLAPVHHTNEIAQSKAAHGEDPVHIWMHGEFLQVDGGKMSKSLHNAFTIDDLIKKGFEPLAFRYFTLNAHYRSTLNFTWESLAASQNALNNIRDLVRTWDRPTAVDETYVTAFTDKINDDLDLPKALALFHELIHDRDLPSDQKAATALMFDQVFGLGLEHYVAVPLELTKDAQELMAAREKAREEKDWKGADEIRDRLESLGYVVEDTPQGQTVKERHE